MLGPLRWSMQKNYEIRCKIIWNIRTKRVASFSGLCNLRFLSTKVLQGSVATHVNYDRIFINSFTANLLQSVMVKEFWKSVSIRRVTGKNKVAPFFSGHGVYIYTHTHTIRMDVPINSTEWIMALNSLICADVPLRNCSLTHLYIDR